MTYQPINGWTKAAMVERVTERVPENGARGAPMQTGARSCDYRLNSDAKSAACAVGAFIPDEEYDPITMSEGGADVLLENNPRLDRFMPLGSIYALLQMQIGHDKAPKDQARQAVLDWIEANVEDSGGAR